MSYPGNSLEEGVLSLSRDAVSVFYSSSRLGLISLLEAKSVYSEIIIGYLKTCKCLQIIGIW